jgi:alanine dehydrogenase
MLMPCRRRVRETAEAATTPRIVAVGASASRADLCLPAALSTTRRTAAASCGGRAWVITGHGAWLSGRVCVVTGASSGIGEATARVRCGGARVALLARRRERVQALAEEFGEAALPLEADVRDLEGV